MSTLITKKHFVCADLEKNSNKFWIGELYNNGLVRFRYGRVGSNEQVTEKQFNNQYEAQKFFDSKVKDKQKVKSRRDAYTEINVIEETGSITKSFGCHDVADIALKEIQTNTQAAQDFVRWLCKINKHNILTNTTIKYDINDGTFKTPLGVIDKICLDKARDLLDQIEPFIERKDFNSKQLTSLVNQYLRMIPQDLGGSNIKLRIKDILPDMNAIEKQSGLIDSLNASISTAKPTTTQEINKVFETSLLEVEDLSDVKKYYNRSSPRINKAYQVQIKSVQDAFEKRGKRKGNIVRTWHGTDPANALSILRQGLVIPRNYTNGRAYGHGIYMTEKPDTPISYAWEKEGKRLMLHLDTALGNPARHGGHISQNDDSLYVPGNGYIIIPRCEQVNILYLVEFI